MTDDRAPILVIPTELNRSDEFWDLSVLAGTALLAWYMALQGLFWWSTPGLLLVAIWTLTGEAAADVPFLGAVAVGLRSKFGLRRAHEWVLAWGHYTLLVTWPAWRGWFWTTRVGRTLDGLSDRVSDSRVGISARAGCLFVGRRLGKA